MNMEFKKKLVEFFLEIIKQAERFKEDVQENAVAKFCEMIKPWDAENKKVFFGELVESIDSNKGGSLTCLIALKQLLEETKEKVNSAYTYTTYNTYGTNYSNEKNDSEEDRKSKKEQL